MAGARRVLVFLALGLVAAIIVSWSAAWRFDPNQCFDRRSASLSESRGAWILEVARSSTGACVESRRGVMRSWGPEQLIGPPNGSAGQDSASAWASRQQDDGEEWVDLDFAPVADAVGIEIHETYCPGSVSRVTTRDEHGREITLWTGTAARSGDHRVLRIPISPARAITNAKITLASDVVSGWNEIDAVGVTDARGVTHWATGADASSSYADATSGPGSASMTSLLDDVAWSGIGAGRGSSASEWAAAFGWPMLAFSAEGTMDGSATNVRRWFPPLRPIWAGLVVDAVVFGAAGALLFAFVRAPVRFVRRMSRMQRGACPRCGFDLAYDFAAGCPECGLARGRRASNGDPGSHS